MRVKLLAIILCILNEFCFRNVIKDSKKNNVFQPFPEKSANFMNRKNPRITNDYQSSSVKIQNKEGFIQKLIPRMNIKISFELDFKNDTSIE